MRRWVAVIAIVFGAALAATPAAFSMWRGTTAAERILDRFGFFTLDGNPRRYLAEAETIRAGGAELLDEAIPALAARAGIERAELDRLAAGRLPALSDGRREIPRARAFSMRYSAQLDAVDEKFRSVYDIPVGGLSLTAVPWLLLLGGLAWLGLGAMLLRTDGPAAPAAAATLACAMLLALVATGAPAKAGDGEDVKAFATRGLTPRAATAARDAFAALDGLVQETTVRTLPLFARRRGVPERRLAAELERDFPAAAALLGRWDRDGPRLSRLAAAVDVSVGEFESAKRMPIAMPVWLLLGGGLVLAALAAACLVRERG